MKENEETLMTRICQTTMRMIGQLCIKGEAQEINYAKLSKCLKGAVSDGYTQLLADMAEADRAFFGNHSMLSTVFNVGCMEMASKAWKEYRL